MNIVVTGRTGIGKTTVCDKVVKIARGGGYSCGGILTHRGRNGDFVLEDILSGATRLLPATSMIYCRGGCVGRYSFNPATVDFCIRAIEAGATSDILVIDEVGPLEVTDIGFASALALTGRVAGNAIMVARRGLLESVRALVGGEPVVFEVGFDNRERLPQSIASAIIGQYSFASAMAEVM